MGATGLLPAEAQRRHGKQRTTGLHVSLYERDTDVLRGRTPKTHT